MVDGDFERPSLHYRLGREHRRLHLTAVVEGGMWGADRLADTAERMGQFMGDVARSALISTVECGQEDPDRIWVKTAIRADETRANALAEQARERLAGVPGVKDDVSAVNSQLSIPPAMERVHKREMVL